MRGTLRLTKYMEDEEADRYRERYPELEIVQPAYSIIESDESVSDDANISNPDNETGYKYGNTYVMNAHVAAILKNPDYIRLAAPRVSGGTFLDAGLGRAYTLLCEKGAKGEYLDLSALSEELPEETVSLISRVLAQNYDIGLSAQDVELYLDRIEHSQPVSSTAGGRTAAELADYLQALKDKKT